MKFESIKVKTRKLLENIKYLQDNFTKILRF